LKERRRERGTHFQPKPLLLFGAAGTSSQMPTALFQKADDATVVTIVYNDAVFAAYVS
jgi:hypothetical protein